MIVLWRVTTLCNLACGFCAYDRRERQPRTHVDAAEVLRLGALLGRHGADTGEPTMISWLGGEPLLWPQVYEVSRCLREAYGVRVSATTNGTTLLRVGESDSIAAAFDELTFSVDALAATHERLRGWQGGWARLAQGVRRLAERSGARPRLRANVVLMRDTLPEFESLCERLADWGIDEITFNQLGGRDRPEFHALQALRPADVLALRGLAPVLSKRMAARGVRLVAESRYLERFEASAAGRAIAVDDCEERRPTVFIDEHNRIASCSFTVDTLGLPTTSLRTVQDISDLRTRLAQTRRARPSTVCLDCPSTQVFAKFGS
jgi:MoaA/NifB/PqqE/SkfB family radical SAM enzyme